ncbi:MAG: chromate efflux transporter [Pseudomonadota bacterium]
MTDVTKSDSIPGDAPTLAELTRVFARIGILSFGGPAAQIALMHRVLVDERRWLTEEQYLGALSFCMLLPGPEAMQLCTYAGWRLRGMAGGLIAGGLFVLPGALVILALALIYANFGAQPVVQALFLGVKAAVVIIVIQALLKVARRALTGTGAWVVAGLAFLGLFAFSVPFPAIIAAAALWGAWTANSSAPASAPALGRTGGQTLAVVAGYGALWAAPLLVAWSVGAELMLAIGLFFSKLAVVTFGGAYAVLAYMTQEVVQERGWLTTAEMIDALGLAETTPGPLILVTEFVAALTGFGAGGTAGAVTAAALALWVTFVPCFLWIFAGAPYIEWITHQPRLKGALNGITAAVVGVIANLSLWFAAHVFFAHVGRIEAGPVSLVAPDSATLDLRAATLAVVAAILLLRLKMSLELTLAIMALGGLALGLTFDVPVG